MTIITTHALAAAGIAAALAATPVHAADARPAPGDPDTEERAVAMEVVFYSDLDLSTERGRRELRSRLRDASRYVCGMDIRGPASRFASAASQQCYAERLEWIESEVPARAERQARRG